jgi:hypothetical protein
MHAKQIALREAASHAEQDARGVDDHLFQQLFAGQSALAELVR